ncbi:MAG: ABC transporter ATP-binding protein, partial [Armatimonadota bacterium]
MATRHLDDDIAEKQFDLNLTKKAFAFIKPYKFLFLKSLLALIFLSATNVAGPYITKHAIDDGIKQNNITMLSIMAILYILVFILKGLFHYYQALSIAMLAQYVTNDIRNKMFSHIQYLSLDFFNKREVGRIISRMMGDVNSINHLVTAGVISLITDIVTAIGVVYIMAKLNLKLTLLTFSLMPLIFAVTFILRQIVRSAYRDVRRKSAMVTASIAQNVMGVKVVKSFSRERRNLYGFKQKTKEHKNSTMHSVMVSSLLTNIIVFMTILGVSIVYYFGGKQVQAEALTVGGFVAFIYYVGLFYTPIQNASTFYAFLQAAMAGAERIFGILETEPLVKDKEGAFDIENVEGKVEFKDVEFYYQEDTPILKGVSFIANPGETIALVGPTGAGKSTIINLITRQYDVTSGSITLDDKDIRDITLYSLRKQMGIVLQDSFLFPGSVMENIRYGRLEASDEEVIEAAKVVGAHEFIEAMPNGYDTDVREGGSRLSTGQKQLVSFARALLADPKILILDEATSSVDPKTEQIIQEGLKKQIG